MLFAVSLAACAGVPEKPTGVIAAPEARTLPEISAKPVPPPQAEVMLSPLATIAPPAAAIEERPSLQPVPVLPAASGNAHVALLLPLNSRAFGRAAEMVKLGFMAAAKVQAGDLPIKVYPSGDNTDDIVATYQQATQAGARIVVGPLTKNGVTALASSQLVSVPTLALNMPDSDAEIPQQLYLLGLAAETEVRQIAQAAFDEGHKTAIVIASGNGLAKRMQLAFVEEWSRLGGEVVTQFLFNGSNPDAIRNALRRYAADMLFLAMDSKDARLLRPFLNLDIPMYATSQIYAGSGSLQKYHDLNGVRFVDMPWLLQPDHVAVMVYPRPEEQINADLERLYALGIDAWRLAFLLQSVPTGVSFSLDGVTGRLRLGSVHQIDREGVLAEFRDGEAALLAP